MSWGTVYLNVMGRNVCARFKWSYFSLHMFVLSGPVASQPVCSPDALLPDQRSLTRHRHCRQVHWCWSCHRGCGRFWSWYWNRFRQPHYRLRQVESISSSNWKRLNECSICSHISKDAQRPAFKVFRGIFEKHDGWLPLKPVSPGRPPNPSEVSVLRSPKNLRPQEKAVVSC